LSTGHNIFFNADARSEATVIMAFLAQFFSCTMSMLLKYINFAIQPFLKPPFGVRKPAIVDNLITATVGHSAGDERQPATDDFFISGIHTEQVRSLSAHHLLSESLERSGGSMLFFLKKSDVDSSKSLLFCYRTSRWKGRPMCQQMSGFFVVSI
jgi:hypothetical protein